MFSCSQVDVNSLENYQLEISYDANVTRPNILVFLVDDLRDDTTPYLDDPLIKNFPALEKLQKEGLRYTNAFVTTSLCSPSRASILSGLYASKHKVIKNDDRYNLSFSAGTILSECGYETAFIGKWHMGDESVNPYPQKGWDHFASFYEQGKYQNPEMIVNGKLHRSYGHMTHILTDQAIGFLEKNHKDHRRPFFLFLSHKAVHHPFEPIADHKNLFEDLERNFEFPVSFSNSVCYPFSPKANPENFDYFKKRYRNYYQSIKGIDWSLENILKTLENLKILRNTMVIFMSDNGYFHGEHQLVDKRYAYEESIKIPLIIRYPSLYTPNSTSQEIALNVDILPTLLDACAIKIHNFSFDGHSLQNDNPQNAHRKFFLYQYFENPFVEIKPYPEIRAIRSLNYKLITYPNITCMDEFYDLQNDPFETRNLILDLNYYDIIQSHYDYLLQETLKYE
jgi:N-acetylglucosamine-6-sulfatase